MILRIDRLAIALDAPAHPSANSASAVQELIGGKFGEMSTLMNYTFQSFNFRGRSQLKPFYDLIANIAAEEYGHIELVAHTINLLLTGTTERNPDPAATPLGATVDARNHLHFIASGQTALPFDSMGSPWNGSYVFSSGNLKLDLLHNFFLECGARANKIRVYEMVDSPVARQMVGYLLVRGGTHIVAYARALEELTGVDVAKLLPIPDISNKRFPEARAFEERGLHRRMYRMSADDYREISKIWRGPHPEDGSELEVVDGPPEGGPVPEYPPEPQLTAPLGPDGVDPEMFADIKKKLFGNDKGSRKKS
jgi:Mn-containing catalase